jgi:hypothetical protein
MTVHHSDKPEARFKLLEAMNEANVGVGNELGHIKWHK